MGAEPKDNDRQLRKAFGTKSPQNVTVGRPESPQAGRAWVQEGDSWYRAGDDGRIDRFDREAGQWREETDDDRLRHQQEERERLVVRKDEQGYGSRARNRNIINPDREQ